MTKFSLAQRRQRGASLIEILVSVLIVTFGILAMAALQANSVKYNKSSELRSVATLLAKDMADRIKANVTGAKAASNNYNMVATSYEAAVTATLNAAVTDDPTCAIPTNCTPAEMAAIDLTQWQRNLFFGLPQTGAYIQYNPAAATGGSEFVDLWVVWDDTTGSGGGAALNTGANGCPPWTRTAATTYNCLYFRVAL